MRNVMLDLETFATDSNAAIVSIGAVFFNIETGETGTQFKRNISLHSNVEYGRTIHEGTLNWWSNQSEDAQQALAYPLVVDLKLALEEFHGWILEGHKDPLVWGNGVLFDNLIIRNALAACGLFCPWHWRNDRDVRTLVAMGKQFGENAKDNTIMEGNFTQHDALSDAIYQVKYCTKIWQHLKSK